LSPEVDVVLSASSSYGEELSGAVSGGLNGEGVVLSSNSLDLELVVQVKVVSLRKESLLLSALRRS
jgi:DNA gyrase/topoisomerase IV subunit B